MTCGYCRPTRHPPYNYPSVYSQPQYPWLWLLSIEEKPANSTATKAHLIGHSCNYSNICLPTENRHSTWSPLFLVHRNVVYLHIYMYTVFGLKGEGVQQTASVRCEWLADDELTLINGCEGRHSSELFGWRIAWLACNSIHYGQVVVKKSLTPVK